MLEHGAYPYNKRLGLVGPYVTIVNLYFSVPIASCAYPYFSLRDTGSHSYVYPIGMMNAKKHAHVQKCHNQICTHLYVPFNSICLTEHYRGSSRPIPLQNLFKKKSFLWIFLAEIAQFSIMAYEKSDLQV